MCFISRVAVDHWTPETCAQKQQSASTTEALHSKSLILDHLGAIQLHRPSCMSIRIRDTNQNQQLYRDYNAGRLGDGRGLPHTIAIAITIMVAVDSPFSLLLEVKYGCRKDSDFRRRNRRRNK